MVACNLTSGNAADNKRVVEKDKISEPDKTQPLLPDYKNIKQLISDGNSTACALTNRIQCWGYGLPFLSATKEIASLENISQFSLSLSSLCALSENKDLKCWYSLSIPHPHEQYGREDWLIGQTPVEIKNIRKIIGIYNGACAIDHSGSISCWENKAHIASSPEIEVTRLPGQFDDLFSDNTFTICGNKKTANENEISCYKFNKLTFKKTIGSSNLKEAVVVGDSLCVIDEIGVKCWNTDGKTIRIPADLKNPKGITLSEGRDDNPYACVIVDNGVRCWGLFQAIVAETIPITASFENPKSLFTAAGWLGNGTKPYYYYLCASTDEGVKCWENLSGGSHSAGYYILNLIPSSLKFDKQVPKPVYCDNAQTTQSCINFSGVWMDSAANSPTSVGDTYIAQTKCDRIDAVAFTGKNVDIKTALPLDGKAVWFGTKNENNLFAAACFKGNDLNIEILTNTESFLFQHSGDRICTRQYIQGKDNFLGCTFVRNLEP